MLPFNPSFRNLLRRFIPQLIDEDVDNYENAVSLWHQFRQEKNILDPEDPNRKAIDKLIEKASRRTNEVLSPVRKEFNNLQRLYTARRRLGLSGGKFLQIPSSPSRFVRLIKVIFEFRRRQFITFWRFFGPRLANLLKAPTAPKLAAGVAMVCLLAIGGRAFHNSTKQFSGEIVESPQVETFVPASTTMDPTTGTTQTIITTKTTITTTTHTTTTSVLDTSEVIESKERMADKPN